MDAHSYEVLEYEDIKTLLSRYGSSSLAQQVIASLRPSKDPDRLALSLRQANEARDLLDRGREIPVRGLRDMARTVAEGHRANRALGPGELLIVRTTLAVCDDLKRFFTKDGAKAEALAKLAESLLDHGALMRAIDAVVDSRGEVLDEASDRLSSLRRRRRALEEELREIMDGLVAGKRFRPFLQERTWTVRNGRYVLLVRLDSRGHVPGILHDKSASGETAFVEPQEVVAKSNELSEVRLDEDREVTHLLLTLSQHVYAEEQRLQYTQNVAAWLDFTAARARFSADLGLRPARLVEGSVIKLKQARHPLLLVAHKEGRLKHEVVPTTLTLGADFSMMVVTGPNTGGKTVLLKTVGLLQLMFQSGLHLPCGEGTELPCFTGIFADIGDEQSLAQNLSTFSGHVENIVRILDGANEQSLVLLDELGAGTDPEEGAALGEAVLDALHERKARTLVTTHLGILKGFAFSRPDIENASVAFDPKSLQPTFELLVGQPGSSQALSIARRHGMPEDIVRAAEALSGKKDQRAEELMTALMHSRVAAEEKRRASEDLMDQSRSKLSKANEALKEAQQSKGKVEQEAEAEVGRILDEFGAAARPHLNALKNVPKALADHVSALESLLARRLHVTAFADRRREFLSSLKKHDQVFVPRFQQVCRIEKLKRSDERLTVKVGGISMDISFEDISWVTPPEAS